VIADVALEECMKAVYKRTDDVHIFAVPRLFTPRWTQAFHKLCDFHFSMPVGSTHWPSSMHEPLWIGISLPLVNKRPWTLRGTPLLVELARDLWEVLSSGEGDGRDILRKLLQVPRRVQSVLKRVPSGMLHLPGQGQFLMAKHTDVLGNVWFKQDQQEHRMKHGTRGAHVSLPFQCESCWIMNLEGRLPIKGLDDTYVMLVRRINLDIMNGRAKATLESHAASVLCTVRNCQRYGNTPSIPVKGPMPLTDSIGMGLAVEMIDLSLDAKGRINLEGYIHYNII